MLRARNFQKKQKQLKNLRKKAEFRNPDEFYHGMHRSQVVDGEHRSAIQEGLDAEEIMVLKNTDIEALSSEIGRQQRRLDKLKESHTVSLASSASRDHRRFDDDDDDEEEEEEDRELKPQKKRKKRRKDDDEEDDEDEKNKKQNRELRRLNREVYGEIRSRERRLDKLKELERRKRLEKLFMTAKGTVKLSSSQKNERRDNRKRSQGQKVSKVHKQKRRGKDEEGNQKERVYLKFKRQRSR